MKRLNVYIHFIVQGEAIEELCDMREGPVDSIGALETLLEESSSATVTKIEETGDDDA